MIKIFHTADWHLGKKFFQHDRREDQEYFLNWLLDLIKKESPDVVIVAGDIFDTHHPPHYAQKLFYNFLQRASSKKTKIIFIAGNHDSKNFLNAPEDLFLNLNIYFKTNILDSKSPSIEITDQSGSNNINLFLLPFFRWPELNEWASRSKIEKKLSADDKNNQFQIYLNDYIQTNLLKNDNKNILISHHSFGQYYAEGSELNINLSGIESFNPSRFNHFFKLILLGHIHKPQEVSSNPPTMYSGSPLVFRNGEKNEKFINQIIINQGSEKDKITRIQVPNIREIITLKLTKENWYSKLEKLEYLSSIFKPYLTIYLAVIDGDFSIIDQIKNYLREKHIILINIIPTHLAENNSSDKNKDIGQIYDIENVFELFYKSSFPNDQSLLEIHKSKFKNLIDEIKQDEVEKI